MKKKLMAFITFAMAMLMTMITNMTVYAAGTQFVEGVIPTAETPGGVTVYGCYYDDFPFTIYTLDFPEEYLLAIDAAGITNEMTDYEKCVRINNYLCAAAEYGQTEVTFQTAFAAGDLLTVEQILQSLRLTASSGVGLLRYGKAICSGYADAFQTMTSMLGMESYVMSSESLNHGWNIVVADGVVYFVDVTWNDCTGTSNYLMSTVLWEDHNAADIVIGNTAYGNW